ncbi:pyruvate formate-lyase activating enzyme-like uncharacterized protein [Pedobacter cryoconitis]|uniref:hypothetical protein n=1 Tax=Pedobacter cryoconitis TaxID=188932 RepID=UPI0016114406|nr:hypothetical protein [Pedobacter cryoconitis]MBB6269742.1 pyruvate formate-lyase activating enzyme-like uncharacterized protein [Pedobacter cryoconitis]
MGYAKERGKLEKLLRIVGLNTYDEKSLAALVDTHEKYSHTVRILKNKEPEIFSALYTNELQEVKDSRKALKEADTDEARQTNFIAYKETLLRALENAIKATNETL